MERYVCTDKICFINTACASGWVDKVKSRGETELVGCQTERERGTEKLEDTPRVRECVHS